MKEHETDRKEAENKLDAGHKSNTGSRTDSNHRYTGAIIAGISAIIIFVCAAYFLNLWQNKNEKPIIPAPERIEVETERIIDFDKLLAENEDTIGWIEVPGTDIDYPIVICGADVFYLYHNFHGEYDNHGTIFVDDFNGMDFSQLHTVIYGHNMLDESMFSQLHHYYDEAFFEKNREIYIYTPDKGRMTYKIFAAYDRDDLYILKMYDYNTAAGHMQYLRNIPNDVVGASNIDEELLDSLTEEDHIITLSTCTDVREDWRLLVQAVYVPE